MNNERLSDAELAALEAEVASALQTGDRSRLTVLGFGEVSVALGHPAQRPTHACKRTPPFTVQEFERYAALIEEYVTALRAAGIQVIDTEVRSVARDGSRIAYVIQPMLSADSIGGAVLRNAEPDPDHPFLVALGDAIQVASPRLSIDAQVTNWSWDGSSLTLLDVGTPFLWDDQGTMRFDMNPFLAMIPAPTRRVVKSELTTMIDRWQQPAGVALDIVANLLREGLDDWVDPTLIALNRTLGAARPIERAAAQDMYEEDLKTWPRLEKLKRIERAWRTTVRRQPYDFFVQSTYESNSIA